MPAKRIVPPWNKSQCTECDYKCAKTFSYNDRTNIFQSFWSLTDNEKTSFYLKHVKQEPVKRYRSKSVIKLKQYTFKYYFEKNNTLHRVCRIFFLSTLNISQKRIYYCFEHLKDVNGTPLERIAGKNVKRVTPPEKLAEVREHISSFPAKSCPAGTDIKYLNPGLNIVKMYNMYTEQYANPISINMYRKVFKEEFKISFDKPKIKFFWS